MLCYHLNDNPEDSQFELFCRAFDAFGEPDSDPDDFYCNLWVDLRNTRPRVGQGTADYTVWEARTPAGELWLALNVPEHAERVDI